MKTVFLAVALVLLTACGGGGGGGTPAPNPPPTPAPTPTDTTPNAFSFATVNDASLSSEISSNSITVSGTNAAATISISNGQYAINGGVFVSVNGSVDSDDEVVVRLMSASTPDTSTSATVTIGGVSADFVVNTQAADTNPDAYNFSPANDRALQEAVLSNIVTIAGINTAATISINEGEYAINSGEFTSLDSTINNGDTLQVRLNASDQFNESTTATITIGETTADFIVSTISQDSNPAQFTFIAQNDRGLLEQVTSNVITITGINMDSTISITGGEYSINGGDFTAQSAVINNEDTLQVRMIASAEFSTTTSATLSIGDVSATFDVTSVSEDTAPEAFSFTAQTDSALEDLVSSNIITIAGVNTDTNVSIVGGEYAINGTNFTTSFGTVNNGDTIQLRLTTADEFETTTSAKLTVGENSAVFSVTTLTRDITPETFVFESQSDLEIETLALSNIVTITGINDETTIGITGGEYAINGGDFTANIGTIGPDDTLQLRVLTSNMFATNQSATVTVGTTTATFEVSTRELLAYITTWQTNNAGQSEDNQITLTLNPALDYNFTVDWGDGTTDENVTSNITHTYASEGIKTVTITGTYPAPYFTDTNNSNNTDSLKLLSVEQWGNVPFLSMQQAFFNADNVVFNDVNAPTFEGNISMNNMFSENENFNSDIGFWDVSKVVDMSFMFNLARTFNQDISTWNVSNVSNMNSMFNLANAFNQDIGDWDVSKVRSMNRMFREAFVFNQDLNNWTTDALVDMGSMFQSARAFNGDISDWNTANVTNFNRLFAGASVFNQNISQWNTANVENMDFTFLGARRFNQDIGGWEVAKVTRMLRMFDDADDFNRDIGGWTVSNVTNMEQMFEAARSFNQDLSSWDVSNVSRMNNMFVNTQMSVENYDAMLNAWSNLTLQTDVQLNMDSQFSSAGEAARQSIIDNFNWNIVDEGLLVE